jgi:hypothetical protein
VIVTVAADGVVIDFQSLLLQQLGDGAQPLAFLAPTHNVIVERFEGFPVVWHGKVLSMSRYDGEV